MSITEQLTARNRDYPSTGFTHGLRMMPALRAIVIGCVDPRVDPESVLGVGTGEVAVLRNVGGRVTPHAVEELAILRRVTRAAGGDLGEGWEVIVLQHTDCGITRLGDEAPTMAAYLGVRATDLHDQHLDDPRAAVRTDVERLRAVRNGPGLGAVTVSGLVYDVATGLIETVVEPS